MSRRTPSESTRACSHFARFLTSSATVLSLNIAEDLCQKGRPYEAVPYLQKAMEDPRNLDAAIQAAFLAPNFDEAVDLLLSAEKIGSITLICSIGIGPLFIERRRTHISEEGPWLQVLRRRRRLCWTLLGSVGDPSVHARVTGPGAHAHRK